MLSPGSDRLCACLHISIYWFRTNSCSVLPGARAVSLLFNYMFFCSIIKVKAVSCFMAAWARSGGFGSYFWGCNRHSWGSGDISLVFQAFHSPSPILHHHPANKIWFFFLDSHHVHDSTISDPKPSKINRISVVSLQCAEWHLVFCRQERASNCFKMSSPSLTKIHYRPANSWFET